MSDISSTPEDKRARIVSLASKDTRLERHGRWLYGKCPFHKGEARTFLISPEGNYHCAACGESGNADDYVKKIFSKPVITISPQAERLYRVNKEAEILFQQMLYSRYGAEGMAYVTRRGLTDQTLEKFGIGYAAAGTLDIERLMARRGITAEDLVNAGLFGRGDDGKVWFRFRGRVMFPIRDAEGRTVGFSGRVTDSSEPKYKNSPETEVFRKRELLYGFDRAAKSGRSFLILCEGQMDVIAMQEAGFINTAASLGTSLTESHVEAIRAFTDKVILLYDTDAAGQKATERAISMLGPDIRVWVTNTSPCKDPDEYLHKYGPQNMLMRIRSAQRGTEWQLSQAKTQDGAYDAGQMLDILLRRPFRPEKAGEMVRHVGAAGK